MALGRTAVRLTELPSRLAHVPALACIAQKLDRLLYR